MAVAGVLAAGDPAARGRARRALLPGWLHADGKAGCRPLGKRDVRDKGAHEQDREDGERGRRTGASRTGGGHLL